MTWVRLDPDELGVAGAMLRDASLALTDSTARIRMASCTSGAGRHTATLMAEGEGVAVRVVSVTESYLRMAIDVIQRAIMALQEAQLVSSVGGVGSVSAAVIGGSTVGGSTPGWSSLIGAPTIGTVGGTGPAVLSISGGVSSGGGFPGPVTATVGGSWSTTSTDSGLPPGLEHAALGLAMGARSSRPPSPGGISVNDFAVGITLQQQSASELRRLATITPIMNANNLGITATQSQQNAYSSANNVSYTSDRGRRP